MWGYQRIVGELKGLGMVVSATTVRTWLRPADRQSRHTRDSQTQSSRSDRVSRAWEGRVRSSTWSWCRNARISSCKATRVRSDARRVETNETMMDRIKEDPIRADGHDQCFQQEPDSTGASIVSQGALPVTPL